MEISNFQKVKFNKGENVAFFDLQLDYIKIKNCKLFRSKTNMNFYWDMPCQKFISKKTGKAIITNIIEMQDEHLKFKVLKLVVKTYHQFKNEPSLEIQGTAKC
jgi:hypothetical protein